jgi:hypothetical protein
LAYNGTPMARESNGLLIGERADLKLQEAAFAIAKTTADVACPNGLVSVHFAPD